MPLMLAARDEAAEFDESDSAAEMFTDDPRYIMFSSFLVDVYMSKEISSRNCKILRSDDALIGPLQLGVT